ncbi:MAG TPA: type III pantothenate kinase [Planctomycetaceae bacterium]|nr:type III pantothenate kinase [Planctomycetaceae bacterium]
MTTHVLAIDVGNSRIKLGLLERVRGSRSLPRCADVQAVPHDASTCREALRAYRKVLGDSSAIGVVAGVNSQAVQLVLDAWPRDQWPAPLVLEDPSPLPIDIRVDEPRKVGIDRVLNAVAANVVRPAGRPAVIVDCGTATTVDAVSAAGAFEGGAILAGLELAARSLHEYTARLPLVSMDELATGAPDAIGRHTRAAIASGVVWGQVGAIRELVARVSDALAGVSSLDGGSGDAGRSGTPSKRGADGVDLRPTERGGDGVELRPAGRPVVFLTGGGASVIAPHLPDARVELWLALQGLALVAFAASDRRAGGG